MNSEEKDPFEGDEIESVEQQMRIHRLKGEASSEFGINWFEDDNDTPPDIQEGALESLLAWERASDTTLAIKLGEAGISIPNPNELDDTHLSLKLWQIIDFLAKRNIFFVYTNHLSDREFYTELWEDMLHGPFRDTPFHPDSSHHFDMIGTGSEEDTLLSMKYYADEKARAYWMESFPDYEMPEHEDPPYDRDRHLPKWQPQPAEEIEGWDDEGFENME